MCGGDAKVEKSRTNAASYNFGKPCQDPRFRTYASTPLYLLSFFDPITAMCRLFSGACMLLQTLFKTGAIAETRAVHLIMEAMTLVIHLNVLFWQ